MYHATHTTKIHFTEIMLKERIQTLKRILIFHLYEVQEQAKLICGDGYQITMAGIVWGWWILTREPSGVLEINMYLDLSNCYIHTHTHKITSLYI